MSEPIVYLNNGFVPAAQAKLNIYDLGIALGATLTEMTRTFRHQPYCAEDHVSRLYRSLKYSGIAVPLPQDEILTRTRELAEANCKLLRPDEDIGIVHFVAPGERRSPGMARKWRTGVRCKIQQKPSSRRER